MNVRGFLLACAGAGLLSAADPGLMQVRHVYVLPMSGGLDQYLASRLVANGRYTVVTDPNEADALLTDQIGTSFEDKVKELYPPPPPPASEKPAKTDDKDQEKSVAALMGEAQTGSKARGSSFTRGKGNIFLVDRESKRVLWSTFLRPRSTRPDEMNRTADTIVDRLDDEAKRRVKQMTPEQKQVVTEAPKPAPVAAKPAAPPAPAPTPAAAPAKPVTAPAK